MSDDARTLVAAETGVPADLLTGDDEATLREQAAALLAYRDGGLPPRPRGPRPDHSQGVHRPTVYTPAEIARSEYDRRHGGSGRPSRFNAAEIARAEYEVRHGSRDGA